MQINRICVSFALSHQFVPKRSFLKISDFWCSITQWYNIKLHSVRRCQIFKVSWIDAQLRKDTSYLALRVELWVFIVELLKQWSLECDGSLYKDIIIDKAICCHLINNEYRDQMFESYGIHLYDDFIEHPRPPLTASLWARSYKSKSLLTLVINTLSYKIWVNPIIGILPYTKLGAKT